MGKNHHAIKHSEKEELLKEYPYRMRKSIAIVITSFFLLSGACFFYFGWKEQREQFIFLGIGSLFFALLIHIYSQSKTKLIVFKDKIFVPYGFLHRKLQEIEISEITEIDESSLNNTNHIRLIFSLKKPVFISEYMLEEDSYYELFDYLENVVKGKPSVQDLLSPVEEARLERKSRIISVSVLATPPFFLIISRMITGQLQTQEDWGKTLFLGGLIIGIQVLVGKVASYSSKKEKEAQRNQSLSRKEVRKLKNRWSIIAYAPSLVSILVFVFLLRFPYEGITDPWPFITLGITSAFFLLFVINKFTPQMEGVISFAEKGMAFIINLSLLSLTFFFLYIVLNINLDTSKGVHMTSSLTGEFYLNKREACYRVAHWETGKAINAGDEAICSSKYPRIKNNEKIEFVLRDGYFKQPWIEKLQISKFLSNQTLLSTGAKNIRFSEFAHGTSLWGINSWSKYEPEWEGKCRKNDFDSCRLLLYYYGLNNDLEKAKKIATDGCSKSDFLLCYSVFSFNGFNQSVYLNTKNKFLEMCKGISVSEEIELCENIKQLDIDLYNKETGI